MYKKCFKFVGLSLMFGLMAPIAAKELSVEQLEQEKVSYTFLNDAGDSLWSTPGNWRKGKFKAKKSTEIPGSEEDLLFTGADLEIVDKQLKFKSLTTGFHRDSSVFVDQSSSIKANNIMVGFVGNKKHSFNNKGKLEPTIFTLKNGVCNNEGKIFADNVTIGRKDSKVVEFNNSGHITAKKIFAVNMNESGKITMTGGSVVAPQLRVAGSGLLSLEGGKMTFDKFVLSDDFRIKLSGSAKIVIRNKVKSVLYKKIQQGKISGEGGVTIIDNKNGYTIANVKKEESKI
ncbi:hypothetical protein PQO01_08630 [Lentisphaera marina]|uniref:hypothetical protein n=1 Tax=Lentisphaera marina TaxID=1111041 RepID=UPI0023652C38|nr:hypothetical protein [Lentisphaera marina]MDD7985010.1 hypothetical protein [Lentisphaera marina]